MAGASEAPDGGPRPLPAGGGPWPARYDMLDGWRGVAALLVVVNHVARLPIGHWAVMLFFVISGYCIAASATSCLARGLGFRTFMWRRLRRIYPPYLLSLLFFAATRLVKVAVGGANDLGASASKWLQNLTLTQWLTLVAHPKPYAAQNRTNFVTAYWSLNYEEQFYLVVALLMVIGGVTARRAAFFVLLGAALALNVFGPRVCYGFFLDYWAHFAVGVLLFHRLCRMAGALPRRATDAALLALALGSGWAAWGVGPGETGDRPVFAELALTSGFGLLLIGLRPLDGRYAASWAGRALGRLGVVSYSLYLIHQFNLQFAHGVAARLLPAVAPWWAFVTTEVVLHLTIAALFWWFCERPFLNRPLSASALPRQGVEVSRGEARA